MFPPLTTPPHSTLYTPQSPLTSPSHLIPLHSPLSFHPHHVLPTLCTSPYVPQPHPPFTSPLCLASRSSLPLPQLPYVSPPLLSSNLSCHLLPSSLLLHAPPLFSPPTPLAAPRLLHSSTLHTPSLLPSPIPPTLSPLLNSTLPQPYPLKPLPPTPLLATPTCSSLCNINTTHPFPTPPLTHLPFISRPSFLTHILLPLPNSFMSPLPPQSFHISLSPSISYTPHFFPPTSSPFIASFYSPYMLLPAHPTLLPSTPSRLPPHSSSPTPLCSPCSLLLPLQPRSTFHLLLPPLAPLPTTSFLPLPLASSSNSFTPPPSILAHSPLPYAPPTNFFPPIPSPPPTHHAPIFTLITPFTCFSPLPSNPTLSCLPSLLHSLLVHSPPPPHVTPRSFAPTPPLSPPPTHHAPSPLPLHAHPPTLPRCSTITLLPAPCSSPILPLSPSLSTNFFPLIPSSPPTHRAHLFTASHSPYMLIPAPL